MNFFIPGKENDQEGRDRIYDAIRSFAHETLGWKIKDSKIFSIQYRHSGKEYYAEVGKIFPLIGETVIAILESNIYLICTPNRGVIRDLPVLVGREEVIKIVKFDD